MALGIEMDDADLVARRRQHLDERSGDAVVPLVALVIGIDVQDALSLRRCRGGDGAEGSGAGEKDERGRKARRPGRRTGRRRLNIASSMAVPIARRLRRQ